MYICFVTDINYHRCARTFLCSVHRSSFIVSFTNHQPLTSSHCIRLPPFIISRLSFIVFSPTFLSACPRFPPITALSLGNYRHFAEDFSFLARLKGKVGGKQMAQKPCFSREFRAPTFPSKKRAPLANNLPNHLRHPNSAFALPPSDLRLPPSSFRLCRGILESRRQSAGLTVEGQTDRFI